MKKPKYTIRHDRPAIWRGDSLDPLAMSFKYANGDLIIPESVCAQIRDKFGGLVHKYDVSINDVTGKVILERLDKETTSTFPVGVLTYDVEYFMSDGSSKTYVTGELFIDSDASRCRV